MPTPARLEDNIPADVEARFDVRAMLAEIAPGQAKLLSAIALQRLDRRRRMLDRARDTIAAQPAPAILPLFSRDQAWQEAEAIAQQNEAHPELIRVREDLGKLRRFLRTGKKPDVREPQVRWWLAKVGAWPISNAARVAIQQCLFHGIRGEAAVHRCEAAAQEIEARAPVHPVSLRPRIVALLDRHGWREDEILQAAADSKLLKKVFVDDLQAWTSVALRQARYRARTVENRVGTQTRPRSVIDRIP